MDEEAVKHSLSGQRVLVIEDESLVTMLMEDSLTDIGCEVVGTASRLEDAIEKASSLSFDVAILDVNLNGQYTYTLAEILAQKGVPFLFATGYGTNGLPEALRNVPILPKPFQQRDLEKALNAALNRSAT